MGKELITCKDTGDGIAITVEGTESDIVNCIVSIVDKLDLSSDALQAMDNVIKTKLRITPEEYEN